MRNVLAGLIAALVIAAGGYFGFEWYVQRQVASGVEAAFDQIRSTGAKASHGKVSYDPWTRTLSIADITSESATQPAPSFKIGSLVASGIGQPDATHFSAESVEVSDIEVGVEIPAPSSLHLTYKALRVTAKDLSGPVRMTRLPAPSSPIGTYRFLVTQFIGISATSIEAATITGTVKFGIPGLGEADFAYSGAAFEGIKDGKIATSKLDELTFTLDAQQAGKPEKLTGHLANLVASDFDMAATAALLDPDAASDASTHRMYRQISTGAYEVTSGQGVHTRIDGIRIGEVSVQPSRVQFSSFLAAMPRPGTVPTPAQVREKREAMAKLYEGMSIGDSEIRGLSMEAPEGPIKLSAIRLKLDNGRGDLALEGLDGRSEGRPIHMGSFTLKSFDIAGLLRVTAQFANPAERPAPVQALGLFRVLEGAEIKDIVAPYKNTNRLIKVDTFSLSWGQLVGSIPTQAHLVAKMTTPLDTANPALLPLPAAGIDKIEIDADLGAGWTEASGTFALEPVKIELGNLISASARVSLANVPRGLFTSDLQQAATMATQVDAGRLEFTLHDLGLVDLLIAQYARNQKVSREDARSAILDRIKASGEKAAAANPEATAAVETLTRFVETPQQTLVLKLTPLGKVPALPLLQMLKTDPFNALSAFKIEASIGL